MVENVNNDRNIAYPDAHKLAPSQITLMHIHILQAKQAKCKLWFDGLYPYMRGVSNTKQYLCKSKHWAVFLTFADGWSLRVSHLAKTTGSCLTQASSLLLSFCFTTSQDTNVQHTLRTDYNIVHLVAKWLRFKLHKLDQTLGNMAKVHNTAEPNTQTRKWDRHVT